MKFDLSKIELSYNDKKRNLKLPENPSKELAEFFGILIGDGYLNYYPNQNKYIIEIAGDSKLDFQYLRDYVSVLIKEVFNIEPTIYIRKDQNSMYLRLISKGLVLFLIHLGFKKGKKDQIKVPEWILSNEEFMVSFIKGIADTDCSIHFRNNYPIISFYTISKPLILGMFSFLKKNQFILKNYYKEKRNDKRGFTSIRYRIRLNGIKNFNQWINLIYFRNKRHLRKIKDKMGMLEFESRIQDQPKHWMIHLRLQRIKLHF